MLQDLRFQKAFPKPIRSKGPILGIGTEQNENSQSNKEERPMAPPLKPIRASRQGENPNGENHQPSPVVVILRPRHAFTSIRLRRRRSWNVGDRASSSLCLLLQALPLRRFQLGYIWAVETRPTRSVTRVKVAKTQTIIRQINGWRLRSKRGSGEDNCKADANLDLHIP